MAADRGERTYVGKGKAVGKYGNLAIGIRYEQLQPNERGFIVARMKESDKNVNTHSVYVDDRAKNIHDRLVESLAGLE